MVMSDDEELRAYYTSEEFAAKMQAMATKAAERLKQLSTDETVPLSARKQAARALQRWQSGGTPRRKPRRKRRS